jgi:hypothetical protein
MAAFPCPYCGHALVANGEGEAKLERCPSCDGSLLIAYRYRLVAHHGSISGGELYEALDDGFGERFAVLFVAERHDPAATERFIAGNELFADLGGRGLSKIHDIASRGDPRTYVVMDWLEGSTLDLVVAQQGALEAGPLRALVGDLLSGLSKAHRSMPPTIHGHIHPGKIGFRGVHGEEAVLFGFEWARQVRAQASRVSGTSESEADQSRGRGSDLRQLGATVYYAATGEWLGDQTLGAQRQRAAAILQGPLARVVDRMLGADLDGYESAVEAATDFERLSRGQDNWQAKPPPAVDRSKERMGTAWTLPGEVTDDDEDELEDVDLDIDYASPSPAGGGAMHSPAPESYAAWAASQQAASVAAAASPPSPGRFVGIMIASLVVFATCTASLLLEDDDPPTAPRQPQFPGQQRQQQPPPLIESVPSRPEVIESPRFDEPVPGRSTTLSGTFRYTGAITGPADFAGLGLGERCEVWIEPSVGGDLNCRWYVDCGAPRRRIYGGGDVGYSTCEVVDGWPARAEDDEDDAPDGAFLADLASTRPKIIVQDRWILPPVRVVISLDEGQAHPGPVPFVAHAPRFNRTEIEERTNRKEFPAVEPGVLGDW